MRVWTCSASVIQIAVRKDEHLIGQRACGHRVCMLVDKRLCRGTKERTNDKEKHEHSYREIKT